MGYKIYLNTKVGYGLALSANTTLLMRKSGRMWTRDGDTPVNLILAEKGKDAKVT